MGWNVLAGISNIGFGTISNWTHAAGGEDFSMRNFTKAQTLAWNTLGGKTTKNGKKISNLMKKCLYKIYNVFLIKYVNKRHFIFLLKKCNCCHSNYKCYIFKYLKVFPSILNDKATPFCLTF